MPSAHTCVRVCVCEPPGRGGVEGACEPVAGVVECEWIVSGKAACACEREHVWLGVRGVRECALGLCAATGGHARS